MRGYLLVLCLSLFVSLSACKSDSMDGDEAVSQSDWTVVWSDEFDGVTLNSKKWTPETSCWGGGNAERQCYVDRNENIEVTNGMLKLKAIAGEFTGPKYPEGHNNYPGGVETKSYTSGKIRTRGIKAWTYGRFEARMKLPKGQGTWPAFWMLSETDSYGSWPLSGEIDILEAVNLTEACEECKGDVGENRSIAALHFGDPWPDNDFLANKAQLPNGAEAWHVFAVEWGKGRIDWYVDDQKIFSLDKDDWFTAAVDKSENPYAPFDQPFYLMLNLAVGGGLSEENNNIGFNPDAFPAELQIDWVRVKQCLSDQETGMACLSGT